MFIGLAAMSVASFVFGYAHHLRLLDAARFVQGVQARAPGPAVWRGWRPRRTTERRGAALGMAFAAAVGGALLGPVVGAVASHVGTGPAFAAATVGRGHADGGQPPRPQTAVGVP